MSASICLVNPPVIGVERPSIALGTLKAVLQAQGLPVKVLYANLWFAEFVGLEAYTFIGATSSQEALGEWLFGAAAFPEFETDRASYLDRLFGRLPVLGSYREYLSQERLLEIREGAIDFIDTATERILHHNPRIVGCTSTFSQHVAALALLRRIKQKAPHVVTIMGGANCEAVMGRTTHELFDWVDYVVSGEAESVVTPLCLDILERGTAIPSEETPSGVWSPAHRRSGYPKSSNGAYPRLSARDMSVVPTPDYSDYFDQLSDFAHRDRIIPGLLIETSRGCWWGMKHHCTFCGLNGGSMEFRSKPPAQVLEEVKELATRHGIRKFEAVDNILDLEYFDRLLPELAATEVDYSFFYETKSNLKREQIRSLAIAGVRWIQPGIESLDSRICRLMSKGTTAWQNVYLLKWCRQYGINVIWNAIIGFPGEDDAWYAEMAGLIPALHHLQPGHCVGLQYQRFSPYHMEQDKYGLRLRSAEAFHYVYPAPRETIDDLVYYFEDVAPAESSPASRAGTAAFQRAMAKWRQSWNARPRVICCLKQDNEGWYVEDTRPCAVVRRLSMSEVSLALLEACQDSASPEHIVSRVSALVAASQEAVLTELTRLVDARLILSLDRRLLSIVLSVPVQGQPLPREFPGGFILPPQRPHEGMHAQSGAGNA